jgi:hypothetical protein
MRQVVFPPAPLRTVREVLPHTALPQTFGRRGVPLPAAWPTERSSSSGADRSRRNTSPTVRWGRTRLAAGPSLGEGSVVPRLLTVLCPAPTPSRLACTRPRRVSPVPRSTFPAFHVPYPGGFVGAALPRASPLPWPSPISARLGSLFSGLRRGHNGAADFASCYGPQVCSPSFRGLCRWASTAGFRPPPPPSYSAAGTLPRPDLHRLAERSLSGRTGDTALPDRSSGDWKTRARGMGSRRPDAEH